MIKNSAKNTVLMIFSILFSCLSLFVSVYVYAYGNAVNFGASRSVLFVVLSTVFSLLPALILALYAIFFYFKRIAAGLISLSPAFAAFYFSLYMIFDFILVKKPNFDVITILRVIEFFLFMFITRQLMRYAFFVKTPLVLMTLLAFVLPIYSEYTSIASAKAFEIKSALFNPDVSLLLYLVAFLFFIAAFENFPVKQFDEDDSDDEYDIPLSDDEASENVEETTENA